MLHDLCPTHEMAPVPVEQGQSGQQPVEGPNDDAQNLNNMIDDVDNFYMTVVQNLAYS